jgi:hypothetical protein
MTTPTAADIHNMQTSARVTRDLKLAGVDPATGRLPPRPHTDVVRPSYPLPSPASERRRAEAQESARTLREHHERERAALEAFTEVIARFFGCPQLDSDTGRSRMRVAFAEARQMARFCGASGEVAERDSDPTAEKRKR